MDKATRCLCTVQTTPLSNSGRGGTYLFRNHCATRGSKADKTNKAVQVTISAVPEYSTDDLLALQKANPVISAVLSFCLQERFPSRSDRQNLPPDALGLLGRLVKEGVLHQRY